MPKPNQSILDFVWQDRSIRLCVSISDAKGKAMCIGHGHRMSGKTEPS